MVTGSYIVQQAYSGTEQRWKHRHMVTGGAAWTNWETDALKSDFFPINISKKSLMTIKRSGWYMGNQISELMNTGNISGSVWFNVFAIYQDDNVWSFIFLGNDGSRYTGVIKNVSTGLEHFKSF